MADKVIGLPTDDELFDALNLGIQQGTPEKNRGTIKQFEPFIAKAKEHVKNIVTLWTSGLELNFTKETGDALLSGFVSSQNFILKPLLKWALFIFGADTFTNFVQATKEGKNNPVTTIGGLTTILTVFIQKLWEKYAVVDTAETVKAKVEAAFA
jgi:hypothetical protein